MTIAELRDDILDRHTASTCALCLTEPCDAYRLATLLSVENVAAGMDRVEEAVAASGVRLGLDTAVSDYAAALLEAIGASHD